MAVPDGAVPAAEGGGDRSARPSVSSISSIANQSADDSDSGFHGFQSRDDPSHASNNNSSPNSVNTGSFPGSSSSNNNAIVANNPSNASNNQNNYNNNNNANINDNVVKQQQPQPMVNGWMQQQQQPSPQYRNHPDLVSQSSYIIQQQPHVHQHQQMIYQHQAQLAQQQLTQSHQHSRQPVQNVQPMPRNYGQPVYANAPPKPRRLAENPNDYSTPSPDLDYRKSPVSPDVRLSSKSPLSVMDYPEARSSAIYNQRMPQSLRTDKSGLSYGFTQQQHQQQPPIERRTSETYVRADSNKPTTPSGTRQPAGRLANGIDYEDVYGAASAGPQLYQRPAGPVGYTKGPAPAPISIPLYTQQHQQQHQMQPQYYVVSGVLPNNGKLVFFSSLATVINF